jgi:hypothetical protein
MSNNFISANPRPTDLKESNDCTVRATSLAMNLPYLDVHKKFEFAGRQPRRGVSMTTMNRALCLITKSSKVMVRVLDEPTFAQFARANPKGRFIVVKRGHAVALIDGVWHDAHIKCAGARSRVRYYYEV